MTGAGHLSKPCMVPGCRATGCFGRRKVIGDWRKGYDWWCAAHRHLMPAPRGSISEPLPPLPKDPGRLL